MESNFKEIIQIIKQSRANAIQSVNGELISLYWNIGFYISYRIQNADWGDKTVEALAAFIQVNNPELKGFSRRGLYKMVQFYDTYPENHDFIISRKNVKMTENQLDIIVPSLTAQFKTIDIKHTILSKISWTNHVTIFSTHIR